MYGATLGAPILQDKLFFFGDYQGVKQLIGVTRISTIPTMAQRQGIFTGVSKIYDPTTTQTVAGKFVRQEFPNDVINIPFDSAAKALLAQFPTPTTSGAANNYSRTANDSDHQNQFDVRVDGVFRIARPGFWAIHVLQRGGVAGGAAAGWRGSDYGVGAGNGRRRGVVECAGTAGGVQRDAYFFTACAE